MYNYNRHGTSNQPPLIGVLVSLFAVGFAVFWTYTAYKSGAPIFFCLFGVLFIVIGGVSAVQNIKRILSGKDSRDTDFDVYEEFENERRNSQNSIYCPYCGNRVENDFEYCNICGRKLP